MQYIVKNFFKAKPQLCYLSRNFSDTCKNQIQKDRFEFDHNKIIENNIRTKAPYFVGFTRPKDDYSVEKKIDLVKLDNKDIQEFMTFFINNSQEYQNVIPKKLKSLGIDCKLDEMYKLYLVNECDKIAGVYPILVENNIAGFCSLIPLQKGSNWLLNISQYLFNEYLGQGIGTKTQEPIIAIALQDSRHVSGSIDKDNIACLSATRKAAEFNQLIGTCDKVIERRDVIGNISILMIPPKLQSLNKQNSNLVDVHDSKKKKFIN